MPVHGIDNGNNKHEVYTTEELLSILQQAINSGSLQGIDPTQTPIVAAVRESHENSNLTFWSGTEAEFNELTGVTSELIGCRIGSDGKLYLLSGDTTLSDTIQACYDAALEATEGMKREVISVTLTAEGWSDTAPYTQTVAVPGMTDDKDFLAPYVVPTGNESDDIAAQVALSCISGGTTDTDSVTFYCYEDKPTTTITVFMVDKGTKIESGDYPIATPSQLGMITVGNNLTIDTAGRLSAIGGGGSITIDSALGTVSTNPVQNKVITAALANKANTSDVAATYATKTTVDTIDGTVSDLESRVSSLASGSPLVASSTAGMTDTTRIYINTSDGHWYYHNGSNWTDGGVYESSDDVNALKDSLDYTDELVLPLVNTLKLDYDNFEIGNIETSSTPYAWLYDLERVRSKQAEAIHLEVGDTIRLKTPNGAYRFFCIWTNSDDEQDKSPWQTSEWTCTEEGDYQFVISKRTEETVTSVVEYTQQVYIEKLAYDPITVTDRVDDMLIRKDFSQVFEMGNINTGVNPPVYGTSTTRVRTLQNLYLPLKAGDVLYFTNGDYRMYIGWYDSGSEWHSLGWKKKITLTQDGDYVIVFRKEPETTISSLSEAVSTFRIKHGCNLYEDIETEIQKNQRRNWFVKSINHRGYERLFPENTLIAFKQSAVLGFDAVETDIRFTSDGVAVLLHDATINRTARNADGTAIAETINIADITYEQALTYDFGIYKGEQFAGTRIPTFEELVALCRKLSLELYAETKHDNVAPLVNIVKKYGMAKHTTWISFYREHLAAVKAADATARLGYIVGEITDAVVANITALKTDDNEVFLDLQTAYDPTSYIDILVANNIGLEAYTPNSIVGISNLNPYVTGVTSDWLVAGKALYDANIND